MLKFCILAPKNYFKKLKIEEHIFFKIISTESQWSESNLEKIEVTSLTILLCEKVIFPHLTDHNFHWNLTHGKAAEINQKWRKCFENNKFWIFRRS